MQYFFPAVFAAVLVAIDQFTKYRTVLTIAPGEKVPLIDGLAHFTYVENTGAAFSMLSGKTWFFLLVTAVFFALVFIAVRKKWFSGTLSIWALAAVCGGAVGNLIDRIMTGYVVDMIELEFMEFPVFNFADCCITVGAVILVLAVLLEKKPK